MPAGILGTALSHLENLRHLDLSLYHHVYFLSRTEDVKDQGEWSRGNRWLIDGLPPNLETFHLRGPVSIAIGGLDHSVKSEGLAQWAEAFGREEYFAHLKGVGFRLGQPGIIAMGDTQKQMIWISHMKYTSLCLPKKRSAPLQL